MGFVLSGQSKRNNYGNRQYATVRKSTSTCIKGERRKCNKTQNKTPEGRILDIMVLTPISRKRFKQPKISWLISHMFVSGGFIKFLAIFGYIWAEIVFLKGLVVKFMEMENSDDLMLFQN